MSKVFIPSVFITTNFSKVRKYFLDVATPSRDYAIPSSVGEDSLLITPENNKYLQGFEYSLNYQDKNAVKLVLSFVDVDNKFEETFLNSSVIKTYIEHALENSIKKSKYFANDSELFSTAIKSQLKIYFAFGVGQDLKEWAGPYCATLVKSELTISNTGLRNYKYTFLPSNSYMFKPRLTADETNPNPYSDLAFNFVNFRTRGEINVGSTEILKEFGNNLRKLLFDYIKNIVSSRNIIVMIPKIDNEILDYGDKILGVKEKSQTIKTTEMMTNVERSVRWAAGGVEQYIPVDLQKSADKAFGSREEKIQVKRDFLDYIPELYKIFGIDLSRNSNGSTSIRELENPEYSAKTIGKASFYNQVRQEMLKSKFKVDGMSVIDNRFQDGWTASIEVNTNHLNENDEANFRKGGTAPNWWKALYKIETALHTTIKGFVGKMVCFQESDLRILKLWKKYGIIFDDQNPCTVVGIDQFIYDTLYCNQSDVSRIIEFKSKYSFDEDDPLKSVLDDNKKYRLDLIKVFYKNKNNSSFNEKIILDELNFNNIDSELLKQQVEAAKLTDIPVFTNNLKNSNILSLSLDLGDTYFAVTQTAVHDNLRKFFADSLLRNNRKILDNCLTQPEAEEIKKFIEDNLDWNEKISDENLDVLTNGGIVYEDSKVKRMKELESYLELIDQQDYSKNYQSKRASQYVAKEVKAYNDAGTIKQHILNVTRAFKGKFDKNIYDTLAKQDAEWNASVKQRNAVLKPYISDKPESEITYLNLALIKKFKDMKASGKLNGVEPEAFLNLAMFIVLANQFNKTSASVIATPKHRGPESDSIAGMIFDYLYKFNLLLNIRTVPFFNISSWKSIPKPAIVVSKKLHTLGVVKNDKDSLKQQNYFDFFSGLYTIQGFKHVINTREAYSEFFLLKNNLGLPDVNQLQKTKPK